MATGSRGETPAVHTPSPLFHINSSGLPTILSVEKAIMDIEWSLSIADRLTQLESSVSAIDQSRQQSTLDTPITSTTKGTTKGGSTTSDIRHLAPLASPSSEYTSQTACSYEILHSPHPAGRPTTTVVSDISIRPTTEARTFLQEELDCNKDMVCSRRTVLESALRFVDQVSNTPFQKEDTHSDRAVLREEDDQKGQPFASEMLYMMMTDMRKESSHYWMDHIPPKVLENMCLSLMEGEVLEPKRSYYELTVYLKSIYFLLNVPGSPDNNRLQHQMMRSKEQYEYAASRALNRINISDYPSLELLQALLSGALLMQLQGDMSRSWALTAYAARILVLLNYHKLGQTHQSSTLSEEIRAAVAWCYYLDKSLSMLLIRPPSLSSLDINPASLVTVDISFPTSTVVKTAVELAIIQEKVLGILVHANSWDQSYQANMVTALVQDMYRLQASYNERRAATPASLEYGWNAVDFGYYTVLTTIFRSNPSVLKGPLTRAECLSAARKALHSFKRLSEMYLEDNSSSALCPIFLTWSMLLYPLTPFFVLCCSVVGTSNPEDFTLMSDVTQILSHFIGNNRLIAKLHKLFVRFITLCSPLMTLQPEKVQQPSQPGLHVNEHDSVDNLREQDVAAPNSTELNQDGLLPSINSYLGESVTFDAAWDDNQVWELFYSQPSLQWLESENVFYM
ncbi:hypothetical protein BDV23DRAFT_186830 [Aspergillus alliaceus]|uniref:Xylanolytic transcriptional activator regulatory domain-containing protein n=1 Tax=Petromyces alliaceus TaxID=209559 RepID=A0A5N7BYP6_PETAA|nr:hypothetical protein BDV23DRAFT_186830 [Aspergillus alliaceus]